MPLIVFLLHSGTSIPVVCPLDVFNGDLLCRLIVEQFEGYCIRFAEEFPLASHSACANTRTSHSKYSRELIERSEF